MPVVRAEFPVKSRRASSLDFPWRNRASRMDDCIGVMLAYPPFPHPGAPLPRMPPEKVDEYKSGLDCPPLYSHYEFVSAQFCSLRNPNLARVINFAQYVRAPNHQRTLSG